MRASRVCGEISRRVSTAYPVTLTGENGSLDVQTVVDEVLPAFEKLRQRGKVRFFGFSGTGEAAVLPHLIDTGAFDVAATDL